MIWATYCCVESELISVLEFLFVLLLYVDYAPTCSWNLVFLRSLSCPVDNRILMYLTMAKILWTSAWLFSTFDGWNTNSIAIFLFIILISLCGFRRMVYHHSSYYWFLIVAALIGLGSPLAMGKYKRMTGLTIGWRIEDWSLGKGSRNHTPNGPALWCHSA